MTLENEKRDLNTLVAELQEEAAVDMARQHLADGMDPLAILDLCQKGMVRVGEFHEQGRYFIAGLIMAGEIMQRIGELVLPLLNSRVAKEHAGSIVLGTVEGDIHFIGKDIFKTLVRGYGFTVHDLGVDVPATSFLAAIHEFKPDIVGLSCLISAAYAAMQKTIAFLRERVPLEFSPRAYVIGGRVDDLVSKEMGADYWANEAMRGVHLCQEIMSQSC
jgi:methanogenic corrinoid protein MtbC1